MANFGGAIKLKGESEYRKALTKITSGLKEVSAQMKLTNVVYDKGDNSVEAMTRKLTQANSKLDLHEQKWKTLKQQLTAMNSQYQENITKHTALENKLNEERAELERLGKEVGTTSKEYKDQKKVVDELEAEYKDSEKAMEQNEKAMSNLRVQVTKAETEFEEAKKDVENLGSELKQAEKPAQDFGNELEESSKKIQKATDGFTVLKGVIANLATQVISRATDAIKEFSRQVVEVGSNFDSSMAKVSAVSGATGKELEQLTEKAKALGKSTKFSASEAADAFNYMAMAGWKTEDMLNGIDGILNLAAASGSDLATTCDIVTDALTAMGYSSKEAGRLADVMAAASSNANTNVEMMGSTFKYVAPVVGSLGYSMEDTAVAIGLMANAGIKADQAGTSLRAILQRIPTDTGGAREAFEKLGGKLLNTDGTMRSLNDVMVDLRKGFSKLSAEQQVQYAKTIAGANAMSGLLAITGATEADFNKLTLAVKNSNGAAEKMAKTMQNNLGGDMTTLKSKIEGIQIAIYEKFEPALRKAVAAISSMLDKVDWEAFGRKVSNAINKVIAVFQWFVDNRRYVIAAIEGIIAAFAVTKIASFITTLSGAITAFQTATTVAGGFSAAMSAMNLTLLANPITAVVAGVTALGVALYSLSKHTDEATEAHKKMMDQLQEENDTIKSNRESYEQLAETQKNTANANITQLANYESLYDELTKITDANGKVKKGYEERASFIVSTLKDALGVEISMNGDVIKGYGNLTKSINDIIAQKKAKIILDSQEALYTEALNKQQEVSAKLTQYSTQMKENEIKIDELKMQKDQARTYYEAARIQDKIDNLEKENQAIQQNYTEQQDLLKEYVYNIGQYETNMELFHAKKYDEMTNTNWEYVRDVQKAGESEKQQLEQRIAETQVHYDTLLKAKKQSGKDIYDSQIAADEKLLEQYKSDLKQYESALTENNYKCEAEWANSLDNQVKTIDGKKYEFKDTGFGTVQMYVDGMKMGQPMTKKQAEQIMINVKDKFNEKQPSFVTSGKNVLSGLNTGLNDTKNTNSLYSRMSSLGSGLLANFNRSLGIHSPSRKMKQSAIYMLQGLTQGIKSEENTVIKSINSLGDTIVNDMNNSLSGINTDSLSRITSELPDNLSLNMANSKDIALNNINDGSQFNIAVEAFKTALKGMKIELDDENVGKFVKDTVAEAIYS